jgi:hypothetical protein
VTSILFLKGQYLSGGVTNTTALPNSFLDDPQAPTSYSWWEFQKNDPYWTGWGVTNKASVKNNGLPGEVIVAWFRPLDESFDGPNYTNELYFMVVNALTATNGTAADCMQEIKMNFIASVPAAVVMLDPETGQLQTNTMPIIPSSGGRRQLVLDLNGGDAALFKFADGAPFVGIDRIKPQTPKLSIARQAGAPALNLSQLTPGAHYQVQSTPVLRSLPWANLNGLLPISSNYLYQITPSSTASFYRVVGIR